MMLRHGKERGQSGVEWPGMASLSACNEPLLIWRSFDDVRQGGKCFQPGYLRRFWFERIEYFHMCFKNTVMQVMYNYCILLELIR